MRCACREKQTAALQKYEGVWASYQGQYDGMEQAQQLAEEREELQQLHQQCEGGGHRVATRL